MQSFFELSKPIKSALGALRRFRTEVGGLGEVTCWQGRRMVTMTSGSFVAWP